ncbi:MAG: hypothetical protein PVS2B2_26670 [Candidatus Acidiferrum sp.]
MKLSAVIVSALMITAVAPLTFGVEKPETPHLVFFTEYIRQLAAVERIRESSQQELKEDPDHTFATMIHSSTLFELELNSEINMLRGMRLKPPHDKLIGIITSLYEREITLWKRMAAIGATILGGPKPGVDYAKLGAEMPALRAQMDFLDQTLFQASPSIFLTLVDQKPDSKGHLSHLLITKEERARLIDTLNNDFGEKMDAKIQNYTVSAASVLRTGLLKDFKCSDEPWE